MVIDEDGNPRIFYPGDYNICVPGHRDIDYREQVLIEHAATIREAALAHARDEGERGQLGIERTRAASLTWLPETV